jgi:hypothetical protein
MQKLMFQFCGIDLIAFWDYTPTESYRLVDWAYEMKGIEKKTHAHLLMTISNAPHFTRKDKKPWQMSDFGEETENKSELTAEQIEELWWNMAE